MRLLITTPLAVVIDEEDVAYIRAQDETGTFGILPHHAGFLTVLNVSVLSWRNAAGKEHNVALRGGVLEVRDGLPKLMEKAAAYGIEDIEVPTVSLEEIFLAFYERGNDGGNHV